MAIHIRWCERCPTPDSARCKRDGRWIYLCRSCREATMNGASIDPVREMRDGIEYVYDVWFGSMRPVDAPST